MEILSLVIGLSFIISMNLPIIGFGIYGNEIFRAYSQRCAELCREYSQR